MIRETKETVTEIRERVVKREYLCDRCGDVLIRHPVEINNNRIKFSTGWHDGPNGGVEVETHAYLCVPCAKVVKSACEAVGVTFEIREFVW